MAQTRFPRDHSSSEKQQHQDGNETLRLPLWENNAVLRYTQRSAQSEQQTLVSSLHYRMPGALNYIDNAPNPNPQASSSGSNPAAARKLFDTSAKCRIVGRPCGQFQGCSIVAIFATTRAICPLSNAFPIMIELRQERLANIARAFGSLTISPGVLVSATIDASS